MCWWCRLAATRASSRNIRMKRESFACSGLIRLSTTWRSKPSMPSVRPSRTSAIPPDARCLSTTYRPSRDCIARTEYEIVRVSPITIRTCVSPYMSPSAGPRGGDCRLFPPEEVPGNDHSLDLRGAFIDLQQLRVAHQFLDGVLPGVSIPPKNLNRVGRAPHRSIGTESLGIARRDRGEISLVHLPGGLVRQEPGRFVGHGHLGEHELHRLVLRDRHPEGLALQRVRPALLHGAPDHPG